MAHEELKPGTQLGGYRIQHLAGRGGMSVVFRAEDVNLHRTVALKVLKSKDLGDSSFRDRFIRESRVASSIDHPNIIPIYSAGEENEMAYIAMRFVEGSDLKTLIEESGALAPDRAMAIVGQAANALDAAHARGLVHRDVKPANIMVVPGHHDGEAEHVYLTDFGLTKQTSLESVLTAPGYFLGTPAYAAPEQIAGKEVDARTDTYALGCVLYECLTGVAPFRRESAVAVLYAHLEEVPPPISSMRPDLPQEIDGVVERALAKSRDERYSTCRELVTGARAALDSNPAGRGRSSFDGRTRATVRTPEDDVAPLSSSGAGVQVGSFIGYFPLRRRAQRLVGILVVAVLVDVLAAYSHFREAWLLSEVLAGQSITSEEAEAVVAWQGSIELLHDVVFVIALLLFLSWFYRAYSNLPYLGAQGLRFAQPWAIAAWLVPIMNFFRPKQIANDIWRGSDPQAPPEQGTTWRRGPIPVYHHAWWVTFVASRIIDWGPVEGFVASTAAELFDAVQSEAAQLQISASIAGLEKVLGVAAAVLAACVVQATTTRQEARMDRLATALPANR
jgi:tRNA A-37 threonylcarbamoyl transferase component Bud32